MSKFWSTGSSSSSSSSSLYFSSDDEDDDDNSSTNSTKSLISTAVDDPDLAWEQLGEQQSFLPPPTIISTSNEIKRECEPKAHTRIACISDTHGAHRSFFVPPCDILIHGGDFTNTGEPCVVEDLSDYFGDLLSHNNHVSQQQQQQPPRVKHGIVCIAGNHELTFQPDHYEKAHDKFHPPKRGGRLDDQKARGALTNCTYLQDSSCQIEDTNIYGSPWTPEYHCWAFNLPRTDLGRVWDNIPDDTDVLITHGPPLGRGDPHSRGIKSSARLGCVDLLQQVQQRIQPRLHVFGHVHSGYGVTFDGTTLFVNASAVSNDFAPRNPCIVVDLPKDGISPAVVVYPVCDLNEEEILDWFRRNEYHQVLFYLEDTLPRLRGDDVVKTKDVPFMDLVDRLRMHRDRDGREELCRALLHLRADSYG
uniref:Calcineurin-like phosphoesterase domain-containing protein n=1 Tax=Ditylum brightwellii TaxID=49249 RepID=A0A6V2GCF7_9STRA